MQASRLLGVAMIAAMGWGSLGSAAAAGAPQTLGGRIALRVVDGKGDLVGQLVQENLVAMQIDGVWVDVFVTPNGFVPSGILYYTSKDCTGQPYLGAGLPSRGAVDASNTLYLTSPPFRELTVNSFLQPGLSGPQQCQASTYPDQLVGKATTFDLNALGLTPPFRVQ